MARNADCTVTLTRTTLDDIVLGKAKLAERITAGDIRLQGNGKSAPGNLGPDGDSFEFWFDIITVNPRPKEAPGETEQMMRFAVAILASSFLMVNSVWCCGFCSLFQGDPLSLPHPLAIEIAVATREALDQGILPMQGQDFGVGS